MKITKITARAGRTLPHPTRSFANVKADIELVAELDDGENEAEAIRDLQVRCEQIVESHSRDVRESILKGEEFGVDLRPNVAVGGRTGDAARKDAVQRNGCCSTRTKAILRIGSYWDDLTDALAEWVPEQREFWLRVQATWNTQVIEAMTAMFEDQSSDRDLKREEPPRGGEQERRGNAGFRGS